MSACTVNISKSESADIVKNQCTANSDCGDGECFMNAAVGVCVAHVGTLPSLLFEITPPGGVRLLQMPSGLERSNEQHDLDIDGASTVRGYIRSSCPMEVTLTPEEQSFGLSATSYVTHTTELAGNDAVSPCPQPTSSEPTQQFAVDVPPGIFDLYVRPASASAGASDAGAAGSCEAVPQLYTGVVKAASGLSCVTLAPRTTQTMDVQIPWLASSGSLDAWRIDVLHPVTGQILSQTSKALADPLTKLPDGRTGYDVVVHYSPVGADDPTKTGQEIIRLSPPTPEGGPTVQLSLTPLVASSPVTSTGQLTAVFPLLGPFPTKVHVDGWVWRAESEGQSGPIPVPSTVTLTATNLDSLGNGIFASYSTTVMVGTDGRLLVDLLPGNYRVRIVPTAQRDMDPHLAAQETTLTVGPADEGGASQAGKGLLVNPAATIAGRAVSAFGAGIASATIQALPATIGTQRCDGADASACVAEPAGVLELSLAQTAFVPRTAAGVTAHDGKFTLLDVDCGTCNGKTNAVFDIVAQPADGTRLPWAVRTGVIVGGALDLAPVLQSSLPIVQRGKVQVPHTGAPATPVPGALIQAYLLRDAIGAPVFDPTGMPTCSSGTYNAAQNATRCISSALQVAETRADADGNYELVLPSSLDPASP
jgi:hypothetical protein